MKKSIIFLSIFLILLANLYAKDKEKTVAVLKKVVKEVSYNNSNNSDWETAKKGIPLRNGDGIKTGSRSLAVISFLDGSILLVRAESIVHVYGKVDAGKENKETHIESGIVGFKVKKQSEDEEFNFTTPTGLASIRGTQGFFQVDLNETMLVVEKGLIEVKGLKGAKESGSVSAGNTAVILANGKVRIDKTNKKNLKLLNKVKKTKTVKYKIETDKGDYEIEILDKQK